MCEKSFVWRAPQVKRHNEQVWFRRWVTEGYSIRQLACQCHWSQGKLRQVKDTWLATAPPRRATAWCTYRHLVFDGTYFHHTACLIVLYANGEILASQLVVREDYQTTVIWLRSLKAAGLNPVSVTMDGNTQVIRALCEVWPLIVIQRCLFHVKHQAEMWLRRPPKRPVAKDLKQVLRPLCRITTQAERNAFLARYNAWRVTYATELTVLSSKDKVEGDLIRAYRSIDHALPDMFHYLDDPRIPYTTNGLEGYFSRLKMHYRDHRGLRAHHLAAYLAWYIFFTSNTNT